MTLVSSLLRLGGAAAGLPAANQADDASKKAIGPALFAINDCLKDGAYHPKLVAAKYPGNDSVATNQIQLRHDAPDNRPTKPAEPPEPSGPPILLDKTAKKSGKIRIDLRLMGAFDDVKFRVESTEPGGPELNVTQVGAISSDKILTLTLRADAKAGKYHCYVDVGKGERKTEALLTVE